MEYKEKLKIWKWTLGVILSLFIISLIWLFNNCGDFGCGLGFIAIAFFTALLFFLALIFTIYYSLKAKGKEIDDKKMAIISGIIFLLSLVGYGITWTIFIIDQNSSTPMRANVPGQLELTVLAIVSGFFTIFFFVRYLVGKKKGQ